jgi:hypothetical protein
MPRRSWSKGSLRLALVGMEATLAGVSGAVVMHQQLLLAAGIRFHPLGHQTEVCTLCGRRSSPRPTSTPSLSLSPSLIPIPIPSPSPSLTPPGLGTAACPVAGAALPTRCLYPCPTPAPGTGTPGGPPGTGCLRARVSLGAPGAVYTALATRTSACTRPTAVPAVWAGPGDGWGRVACPGLLGRPPTPPPQARTLRPWGPLRCCPPCPCTPLPCGTGTPPVLGAPSGVDHCLPPGP